MPIFNPARTRRLFSIAAFDEDSPAAENPILSYDSLAEIFILSWTNPSSIAKGIYFGSLEDAIIRSYRNSRKRLCLSDNRLNIDQGQGQTKIYTKDAFAALGLRADIPYNYVEIELDYARGTNRNTTVALVNRKGVSFNPPLEANNVPRGVTPIAPVKSLFALSQLTDYRSSFTA